MSNEIRLTGVGGEYMETATVVEWLNEIGEWVEAGAPLVTVETAKAATEIPAPRAGYLGEILAEVGAEVAVGALLGRIDDAPPAAARATAPADTCMGLEPAAAVAPAPHHRHTAQRIVASPLARRIARERGIDLAGIAGSGPGGRIKRRDIEAASAASTPASEAPALTMRGYGRTNPAPIVLLHGFGADVRIWQPVIALLPGRTIHALDLPGHGASPLSGARDLDSLAASIAGAVADLGQEAVHLVGHSLGGGLALALAKSGAVPVCSLTLIAPYGLGPEIDHTFIAGFTRATRIESLRPWLARLFADPASMPAGFAEGVMRLRGDKQREDQQMLAEAFFPDGTQRYDLRDMLRGITVPTRIVWGRRDAVIPWQHALSAPGTVALHLLANAGHLPQLEAPDETAAILAQQVDHTDKRQAS